jgi:hypothetical protein
MQKTVLFIVFFWLIACSSEKEAPECLPEEPATKTTILKKPKGDGDWCRACVMGAKWASCQTARAENTAVKREMLQARALERACQDAGFEKDKCPETAILSRICRGDSRPDEAKATKTLQKALFDNLKKEEKTTK